MRILYLDIDTLRPDHLGCYGYHRNTSPNVDRIASEGVRFENCYVSDAPCLPSRSALFSGRFGIHTGVVNHGGTTADPQPEGKGRGFRNSVDRLPWVLALAQNGGFYTVSVSPFAQRHSAWWFYAGFREMYNTGKRGQETADEVLPYAVDWLERNGEKDNWFLHVNFWDPHTPYRTPEDYGNPFSDVPPPSWINEEIIKDHYNSYGPYSAQDIPAFHTRYPRVPAEIASLEDYRRWIDGYDVGIRYADDHIGRILDILAKKKLLDDTVIIISSDHGENQGELNSYGEHQTADHITCRVPFILRWPGITKAGVVDKGLHYQVDLGATILELCNVEIPSLWDGQSFARAVRGNEESSRDYLIVSQCAHVCQRAVRFREWMMIRTYHAGLKAFPEVMLFNLKDDSHETMNLAGENPALVNEGLGLLERWHEEMMRNSSTDSDPLWSTMREGGPLHCNVGRLDKYCRRLRDTGREHHAQTLEKLQGRPILTDY